MSVTNEQRVAEEAVARALRATRANDAETVPKRHPRQTDQCPNIARFAAVLRRPPNPTRPDTWTPQELLHVRGCAFCQSLSQMFNAAAAAAVAAVAQEDTVMNLTASEETHVGLPPAPPGG